ncbi:aminopeptidase Q-like [Cataglyphis hispanica]|uniref:aminopeptidase Q-like n=1 Tax=Cataglyphis hispanica TaxID=1086592 RepID=UPI00218036F4|nr:aminopeptidase Q-like [Cataglyphis hispanica]
MAFRKLLLSGSLTFIVMTAFVTAEINLPSIIPEHYNIKLKTYIDDNKFYGECNVSINIHLITQNINLYVGGLCIIDIILIKYFEVYDKDEGEIKILKPTYFCIDKTHASLDFTEALRGNYILNMRFIGTLADNRGIKTFYKGRENATWWPAIHSKTSYVQQIFPCLDDLTLKSTYNISIMHHKDYDVSSNMPQLKVDADEEHGMVWTHFDTTPPMPTYLVAAIMTNKSEFSKQKLGIDDIIAQYRSDSFGLWYAQSIIEDIMLFLNREWKNVKIISEVNNVAIPNYKDNGVTNLGLIFYRESDMIYDENIDPIGVKVKVERVIGYKVMQEWFHNIFQTSWCSTPWLHEAFITFMGAYAMDKAFPEARMMDLFVVQIQHEVLHWDVDFQSSTSQAIFSEIISYFKASIMLRMVKHAVEQLFWDSMRLCIYDHDYEFVYPHDYWTALKNVYLQNYYYGTQEENNALINIQELKTWMNQKHYPVIYMIRKYDQSQISTYNIIINSINVTNNLSIPLTYTTQRQLNFNTSSPTFLFYEKGVDQSNKHFLKIPDLTNDQWIIFNLQQTGYYRVNYDSQNWELITMYLYSDKYTNIHVLNRAQLVDDAFHLLLSHQIHSSIFWDITKYLHHETDYVAWYPMFKALEYMSSIFSIPIGELLGKSEKLYFARMMMQNTLYDILEVINYTEVFNEDEHRKSLRQEAAKWACLLNEKKCLEVANKKLMQHIKDPEKHKILPWWKDWTYRNGLCAVNSSWQAILLWEDLYNMWANSIDTKILSCIHDMDIIENFLSKTGYVIEKSSLKDILRLQAINNFLTIITKYITIEHIHTHILSNFKKLIPRKIRIVTLTVIINHLFDEKQLIELENFAKNDLGKQELYFEFSEKILYERQKERKADPILLKILDKIKNRRSQIKDLHKFADIFMY